MTAPVRNASNGQFPGRVIAVHGSVIDVRFPAGGLPHVEDAIAIEADPARELIAEVQQHLGPMTVRAGALENTAGLRRGAKARATGAPLRVCLSESPCWDGFSMLSASRLRVREPRGAEPGSDVEVVLARLI